MLPHQKGAPRQESAGRVRQRSPDSALLCLPHNRVTLCFKYRSPHIHTEVSNNMATCRPFNTKVWLFGIAGGKGHQRPSGMPGEHYLTEVSAASQLWRRLL